jgi:molybdopterin molybdotransferase
MTANAPAPLMELDDALRLLADVVRPVTDTVEYPLADALGHITATAVTAPYALPPFDNTGVDGYAFRHADCLQGRLKNIGQSFAGEPFAGVLAEGCAAHIATGAVLPDGADTVVMQENVTLDGDAIIIDPIPAKGSNIRRAGVDIQAGAVAVAAHHRLSAQDIALLGALGRTLVTVVRPVRLGILATGTELQSAGSALGPGQIIDTNSLMLKQLLFGLPVTVTMLGALPDDRAATDAALRQAAKDHDIVISTGGVSVGQRDYIRDAMRDLGTVHFWKLALRPGRPVMFGEIGECLMLGLPGNPVSVMITFLLVGLPLLKSLWGMQPTLPPAFLVPVFETVRKEKHLRSFPRARLEWRDGGWQAVPFHDQSSNLLTSLAHRDGVLDLPTGITECPAGSMVSYRPFANFF